jgi:hypothetical protein
LLVRTYHESQAKPVYRVRAIVERAVAVPPFPRRELG